MNITALRKLPATNLTDFLSTLPPCFRRYRRRLSEVLRKHRVKSVKELRGIAGGMKDFWKCFLSEKYMNLDRPREDTIKILRGDLVKGFKIIILTGRVRQTQARKTRQ